MGNKQGPAVDPKEAAREQKRIITRSERKLEREIKGLERQEAKTMKEVKKLAQAGQHNAAKMLSKDIARNRTQRTQYRQVASQMTVMKNQMASMQMNQNVMQALQGSTQVMSAVNADMNPAQMQQTMRAFAMEMEKAGMQSEMMTDAFEMMEDPSAQEDAEDVYNGILGEIGLEYSAGAAAVPMGSIAGPVAAPQEEVKEADDMEARLAALRM